MEPEEFVGALIIGFMISIPLALFALVVAIIGTGIAS